MSTHHCPGFTVPPLVPVGGIFGPVIVVTTLYWFPWFCTAETGAAIPPASNSTIDKTPVATGTFRVLDIVDIGFLPLRFVNTITYASKMLVLVNAVFR